MRSAVHYIPILTTVFALVFAVIVLRRWRQGPDKLHLAWWGFGLLMYGLGTLTESLTTLLGWQEGVFRAWYITGALLGGAPLAQGTIYLLLRRRTAHILTAILLPVIAVAAVFVLLSPINHAAVEPYRLSGAALEWSWVRLFSPFINLYAATFLIGGALVSAWRFRTKVAMRHRYLGNIAIAIGALLPGIGGTFTRFGHVEVLYVTEFLGLSLIWLGYQTIVKGGQPAASEPSLEGEPSAAPAAGT